MHPFGNDPLAFAGLAPHFQPSDRVMTGSRWSMRDVDPGPDNDFTVVRSGYVHDPMATEIAVVRSAEDRNMVEYRLTGSDDQVTTRPEWEFLNEFEPLGPAPEVLEKQVVTAKRESGSGLMMLLLLLGAAFALS